MRGVAGLRFLVPNDFRKCDPDSLSPRDPNSDRLISELFELSEDFETVGGGFYIVIVHTVQRKESNRRDLELGAWNSVNKLNPALAPSNADKSVRPSKIAGVDGFRASCPIVNRGQPGRFETATFARARESWLVSIMVTSPDADDLKRIDQIIDSIEITSEAL